MHYCEKFAELKASPLNIFRFDFLRECLLKLQIPEGTDKKEERDILSELEFHGCRGDNLRS